MPASRSPSGPWTGPGGLVLAGLAGLALSVAEAHDEEVRRAENLRQALITRQLIGQAQGILMERERITAEQAFDVLRRASQHLNTKLREVAQDLVDTGERPPTAIGDGQSVQIEGLLKYREWNAMLGAGIFFFGDLGQSLRLHAGAGYGIFGSLVIIGFDAEYFSSSFNYSGGLAMSNIDLTGASINTFLIGPALQFNITRDYYIKLSAGLPFFLYGAGNLYLTNNINVPINLNDSSGPPFINILINFKIAPDWSLDINYLSYSAGVKNINSNGINIQDYFFNLYHLGIGIEYEL